MSLANRLVRARIHSEKAASVIMVFFLAAAVSQALGVKPKVFEKILIGPPIFFSLLFALMQKVTKRSRQISRGARDSAGFARLTHKCQNYS
jgi:hypothetical protein